MGRFDSTFNALTIPAWMAVPVVLFFVRFWTLHLSGFGWYHGFNEAIYTEIAAGYRHNPWLLPTRDGVPFFDTGPLTTYFMWASYELWSPWAGSPGQEEAALRFGVLIAYPVAVWAAYHAGEGFYGRGKGKIAAVLVASSPWVLLWFGRAQTDAWMVTGVLLFLAGIAKPQGARGAALIISGLVIGILSKQPALLCLLAVPILYPPPRDKDEPAKMEFRAHGRRVWILALVGFALGMAWWVAMYFLHPVEFAAARDFHLHHRAAYFGNWTWTLVLGLLVGSGGLLYFSWKAQKPNPALLALALGYALFAVIDSPVGHEYYALPAVAILAVMAANWKWDNASLTTCVVVSIALTVPLLAFTGDLDDNQNRTMGGFLLAPEDWHNGKVPVNESIGAPDRIVPQLHIYSGRTIVKSGEMNSTAGAFMVSWDSLDCPEVAHTDKTFKNPPLRLFDCRSRSLDVSETVNESEFLVRA